MLGHSKDHRPDLNQMIVGTILDGQGRPICCELWPGNITDVKMLIPVVDRLRSRFAINRVCIVADRGMISKETIEDLEGNKRDWLYSLGARMRAQNEVRDEVISRGGRYRVVHPKSEFSEDHGPVEVVQLKRITSLDLIMLLPSLGGSITAGDEETMEHCKGRWLARRRTRNVGVLKVA